MMTRGMMREHVSGMTDEDEDDVVRMLPAYIIVYVQVKYVVKEPAAWCSVQ